MLFKQDTLDRIARGEITAALRRWSKPTVRAGGTLVTRVGVLAIEAVDVIDEVTLDDAVAAGFPSVADAMQALDDKGRAVGWGRRAPAPRPEHAPPPPIVRVRFHLAGADPRISRRETIADDPAAITAQVDRITRGRETFGLIVAHPGRRAPDLAQMLGEETLPFKARVRRLKALGLTESLAVGYRPSPRGLAWWAALAVAD